MFSNFANNGEPDFGGAPTKVATTDQEKPEDTRFTSALHGDEYYAEEFHLNFDYCIVFPIIQKIGSGYDLTDSTKDILKRLRHAGIIFFPYLSVDKDELIVLLRASLSTLKEYATTCKFQMILDPDIASKMALEGDEANGIKPFSIPHNTSFSSIPPFVYIYGRFDLNVPQELYWKPPRMNDPFRLIIRLKLTRMLLQAPYSDGGCALKINMLLCSKEVLSFFPLHDLEFSSDLLQRCYHN